MRLRKDGSLGPLFINRRLRIQVGDKLPAGLHPTKGYALRPGWHACKEKLAPHLRQGGDRVWCAVLLWGVTEHERPACQGGTWYTAADMKVISILENQ
jgi:hypothetical protein